MHPEYTRAERLVDAAIHGLGAAGSVAAVVWLLWTALPQGGPLAIVSALIYAAGLVAMLWASAAYNLTSHPEWKERLRRYDHAAIFVMIAGTYTPFMLLAIGGWIGGGLLAVVWGVALAGVAIKLLHPRRWERTAVVMYLILGWIGLPTVGMLISALSTEALTLLGIGGVVYTLGVGFHLWDKLPFQNAVWHGFVLTAAVCHLLAVGELVGN